MASALSMSNRRLSNQPLSMRDRNTLSRFCRAPRASCRRFPTSSGWYLDRNLRRGEEEPNSHWRPEPGHGEGPREVRAQPPSSHPQKVITMEMGGGCTWTTQTPRKEPEVMLWEDLGESQELRALDLERVWLQGSQGWRQTDYPKCLGNTNFKECSFPQLPRVTLKK